MRTTNKAFKTKYPDIRTAPRWVQALRFKPVLSLSTDRDIADWLEKKREIYGRAFNMSHFVTRILRKYMEQEAKHAAKVTS